MQYSSDFSIIHKLQKERLNRNSRYGPKSQKLGIVGTYGRQTGSVLETLKTIATQSIPSISGKRQLQIGDFKKS